MSFLEISSTVRSLICSWSVLLFVSNIALTIMLLLQKRVKQTILSVFGFVVAYVGFHICAEVSDYYLGGKLNSVAERIAQLPLYIIITMYLALTIVAVLQIISCIGFQKTHITSMTVKEATDSLPIGLCIYNAGGYPYIVNHKMNEIAFLISGHALLNGNLFWNRISSNSIMKLSDDRIYRFSKNDYELEAEKFSEIIAEDITNIYAKSKKLEEENEKLRVNNARMKSYSEMISEIIHREEILNSKIRIHDEMNRLLLATSYSVDSATEEERKQIIDTWHKNILMLCIEADSDDSRNPISDLEQLSHLFGIKLEYNQAPSIQDYSAVRLFMLAAEEAMTNAVKHASAKTFVINVEENQNVLNVTFTNDGLVPKQQIQEGGGLRSLRQKINEIGGRTEINIESQYQLTISIPKD